MVGLIQKILFDLIESVGGARALEEVKRVAGVDLEKDFRMNEVYDDAEWRRLFAAACRVLEITPEQAEEAYADVFCKDSLRRWPQWFRMSANARQFLERQPRIHNSFASGSMTVAERKAIRDKFRVESFDDRIVVHYGSPNLLCGLYAALARWILRHYGEEAAVTQERCVKNGDPECEIHVNWSATQATG